MLSQRLHLGVGLVERLGRLILTALNLSKLVALLSAQGFKLSLLGCKVGLASLKLGKNLFVGLLGRHGKEGVYLFLDVGNLLSLGINLAKR